MTTYTNPRTHAVVEDWPHGQLRTTATFTIEVDAVRGERACRVTANPKSGQPSKPKRLTYAARVRIVDGDDGRIYLAHLTYSGQVAFFRGTMDFQHEVIVAGFSRSVPFYSADQ